MRLADDLFAQVFDIWSINVNVKVQNRHLIFLCSSCRDRIHHRRSISFLFEVPIEQPSDEDHRLIWEILVRDPSLWK